MPPRSKKRRKNRGAAAAAAAAASAAKRRDWLVGDLVVAKLRGHRPWPAQIQRPEDYGYEARPHRIFVTFFGTEETCFCTYNKLTPFTSATRKTMAEQLQKINTNPELERAIKEIFAADDELKVSMKSHDKSDDDKSDEDEEEPVEPPSKPPRKKAKFSLQEDTLDEMPSIHSANKSSSRTTRGEGVAATASVTAVPSKVEKSTGGGLSVKSMAAHQVQKLPRKVRIKVSSQSSDSTNHQSGEETTEALADKAGLSSPSEKSDVDSPPKSEMDIDKKMDAASPLLSRDTTADAEGSKNGDIDMEDAVGNTEISQNSDEHSSVKAAEEDAVSKAGHVDTARADVSVLVEKGFIQPPAENKEIEEVDSTATIPVVESEFVVVPVDQRGDAKVIDVVSSPKDSDHLEKQSFSSVGNVKKGSERKEDNNEAPPGQEDVVEVETEDVKKENQKIVSEAGQQEVAERQEVNMEEDQKTMSEAGQEVALERQEVKVEEQIVSEAGQEYVTERLIIKEEEEQVVLKDGQHETVDKQEVKMDEGQTWSSGPKESAQRQEVEVEEQIAVKDGADGQKVKMEEEQVMAEAGQEHVVDTQEVGRSEEQIASEAGLRDGGESQEVNMEEEQTVSEAGFEDVDRQEVRVEEVQLVSEVGPKNASNEEVKLEQDQIQAEDYVSARCISTQPRSSEYDISATEIADTNVMAIKLASNSKQAFDDDNKTHITNERTTTDRSADEGQGGRSLVETMETNTASSGTDQRKEDVTSGLDEQAMLVDVKTLSTEINLMSTGLPKDAEEASAKTEPRMIGLERLGTQIDGHGDIKDLGRNKVGTDELNLMNLGSDKIPAAAQDLAMVAGCEKMIVDSALVVVDQTVPDVRNENSAQNNAPEERHSRATEITTATTEGCGGTTLGALQQESGLQITPPEKSGYSISHSEEEVGILESTTGASVDEHPVPKTGEVATLKPEQGTVISLDPVGALDDAELINAVVDEKLGSNLAEVLNNEQNVKGILPADPA